MLKLIVIAARFSPECGQRQLGEVVGDGLALVGDAPGHDEDEQPERDLLARPSRRVAHAVRLARIAMPIASGTTVMKNTRAATPAISGSLSKVAPKWSIASPR